MARSQPSQFFDHINGVLSIVARLFGEIGAGLAALHRVQFDEPWKAKRRPMYGEW